MSTKTTTKKTDLPYSKLIAFLESYTMLSPIDSTATPWEHLRNRTEDHLWILDAVNFEDKRCHLMVQIMEA